jgi:hypothetical protein
MLADKSSLSSVKGLNQRFRLETSGSRTKAIALDGTTKQTVGDKVLIQLDVNAIVQEILNDKHSSTPFEEMVSNYADHYINDRLLLQPLGKRCANCEFKATDEEMKDGMRSGFHECWVKLAAFKPDDFAKPSVLDIWFYLDKDTCIQNKNTSRNNSTLRTLRPKQLQRKTLRLLSGCRDPPDRHYRLRKQKRRIQHITLILKK